MKQKKGLLLTLTLMLFAMVSFAQKVVTGVITDSAGARLPSVSVLVSGTSTGTTSDDNGKFSITLPASATQLDFMLVGYQKQTVTIGIKTDITVAMLATPNGLADVVVVGYGVQRKRDVTGTISSVKGDDLKNQPVANVATALQGRAAGVDIVRSDGAPGAGPSIRIRGTGTVNAADPLVVIDGVPAGSLSDISPNDIASIEILKDASSSAIYGTRAANGVVLVTTKKGSFGDALKTSVNAYTGQSKAMKYLDVLTAPDLVTLKKESYTNDGLDVPSVWNDPELAIQRTDWQKALFGTGKTNNADIAVRGGNANSTYSFSGNYFDDQGMIVNTYFKRLSARINSEHRILKIFKIGENFLYSTTKGNGIDTRSTQSGTVWSALRFNPAIPVYNEDGTYGASKQGIGDINNPVFTAASPDVNNHNNNVLANAYLDISLFKGLSVRANLGYSSSMSGSYGFQPASNPLQARGPSIASVGQGHGEGYSRLEEYTVTYSNIFAKDHSVNFTGGYSAQIFNGSSFGASRSGFDNESQPFRNLNNGNPANQFNSGGKGVKSGLASYFGRLNYAYKGKYLLTATVRADGSSKFPTNNQWGYFPAFSAGWRISDETFFKENVSFINDLKLTGGWGELGNQSVPDLQYLGIVGNGINYNFGNTPVNGSAVVSLANYNITWERAQMTNISLEFGLLKNKLTGVLTYFDKNTKDMLIPFSIVQTYGTAGIPNQNIGTLNNHGIEAELTFRNTTAGGFTYSIGANASFIKNKVTLLYGDDKTYLNSIIYGRQLLETSRTYEGQPIASFYGFKTAGLYQTQKEIDDDPYVANDDKTKIVPGDVRFVDINSDGKINEDDRTYLGNPNPKVVFGINGTAAYKGFDISFSFAGVSGISLYNTDRVAGLDATGVFNWYADELDRWTGEGTSNTVPRLSVSNIHNNYRSSDMWIEDGSYLSLKNVALGYTFSNLHAGATKLPDARLYVSCYNAFYITGYSGYTPELGYTDGNKQRGVDVAQYPSVRTFTVGASINF